MRNTFTRYFSIAVLLMASVSFSHAQKKRMTVKARIVGELSPEAGQSRSPGVAGAVSGHLGALLIVAGGANFPDRMPWEGGAKSYHDRIHVFRKDGDRLIPEPSANFLPEKVAYAASCPTPQGLFYAGGENAVGISDRVWLMNWSDSASTPKVESLPPLPTPVTNAAVAYCDRRIYLAGGETPKGVTDRCWTIDLGDLEGGWSPLPPLPKPVSHAVLSAIMTDYMIDLYVFGGRMKKPDGISEIYSSVFHYGPSEGRWVESSPLPHPLSAASGVAVEGGHVLLFSGDRGETFSRVENTVASIALSKDDAEKQRLTMQKNRLLSEHPGFSRDILRYEVAKGKVGKVGTLPENPPVTTSAFWWDDAVYIPSGEIRAGVRTPTILRVDVKTPRK
jgi:N-acetylneuraminic acid mutarotase